MKKQILKLWNSPTLTTWGSYLAQSLRLVLVTPLILTSFNETEIAAWYLFASLNFFGVVVTSRLSLTFSRMLAFAMSGATDLAPIREASSRNANPSGKPNWSLFQRAFKTLGALNIAVSVVNVFVAVALGAFALSNILLGYDLTWEIVAAFTAMQVSSLCVFIFGQYAVALRGMNYVALSERWMTLFSLLSSFVGAGVLLTGGGIFLLACGMQVIVVLGVLYNRTLLRRVEGGRVARYRGLKFDREVLSWAWEPTWKGFVAQLGTIGGMQAISVLYTGMASVSEVAMFMFAVRMMQPVMQFGMAPMGAISPLLSRLRSSGDMQKLKQVIAQRTVVSFGLMASTVLILGVGLPMLSEWIGANIKVMPTPIWYLYGALFLLVRFNTLCATVFAIGNEVVFYLEPLLAALFGVGFMLLWGVQWGVVTPIVAWGVPLLCLVNLRVYRASVRLLNEPDCNFRLLGSASIYLAYCLFALYFSSL